MAKKPAPGRARKPAVTPAALMRAAERARKNAYAPYSNFTVGAALLTKSGRVITGSNVENASYGLSMCAERVAVFKAATDGEREFVAIAVACRRGASAAPCGACRQVLNDYSPRLTVYYRNKAGRTVSRRLDQLLPEAFWLSRSRR